MAKPITPEMDNLIEGITDNFERVIATANLLSIAPHHIGTELGDTTIANAATHLMRDLEKLQKDVELLIAAMDKLGILAAFRTLDYGVPASHVGDASRDLRPQGSRKKAEAGSKSTPSSS